MTGSWQWVALLVGVLVLFGVFAWAWFVARKDLKALARVNTTLSTLDRTSKIFNDLTDTIKERREALQKTAGHLAEQRVALEQEIEELEKRRVQIGNAIDSADLEGLKKIIEGK